MLLRLSGGTAITVVSTDLIGDGADAQIWQFSDARAVAGLYFTPTRVGTFSLQVHVEDACGRQDTTGATRRVTVR